MKRSPVIRANARANTAMSPLCRHPRRGRPLTLALALLALAPAARADYRSDVGYSALLQELGGGTPTGSGVAVAQVEASTVAAISPDYPVYAPDADHPAFAGKFFSYPGTPSTAPSSHATGVGQLFYGNASMAAGIDDIAAYEANQWFSSLSTATGMAATASRRIANHSWVGNGDSADSNGTILRMVDRQVQRNEYIQVVGMANGSSVSPLLGNAYNVIAVGRTDGGHDRDSDPIDSTYGAGRTRPDLVAPQSTASSATPLAAAAAALLVQTGHDGALALSNGSSLVSGIGTVYNAERSETVKAALMAGAERETANTGLAAEITDYRAAGHQTTNGLDDRYGAGQLNVYNSYHILAAGEQDSLEDGGTPVGAEGYDYDPSFGGSPASNRTATYAFTAAGDFRLTATLAWNLGVSNDAAMTATLHDLDLDLFDTTTQTVIASSASATDNTENLWVQLFAGHQYQLRVTTPEASDYSWDYALAWRMAPAVAPVPVPAAGWLFATAIGGLGALFGTRSRGKTPG